MSSILRFVIFVSGPSLMEQYLWFTSFLANTSISRVIVNDVSLTCFTVNFFLEDFHNILPVNLCFAKILLWRSLDKPLDYVYIEQEDLALAGETSFGSWELHKLSSPEDSLSLSVVSSESVDCVSLKSSLSLSLFSSTCRNNKINSFLKLQTMVDDLGAKKWLQERCKRKNLK